MIEIKIPFLNPNDDKCVLREWLKKDNEIVKKGESLCSIETSKTILEIDAESSGFLKQICKKEHLVGYNQIIGFITEKKNSKIDTSKLSHPKNSIEKKFTKKAELIAKKNNLDINKIVKLKNEKVTQQDVINYINKKEDMKKDDLVYDVYGKTPERVLILGGGKGAAVVISVIRSLGPKYCITGILDDDASIRGKKIMGYEILGRLNDTEYLWKEKKFDKLIISITTLISLRAKLFRKYNEIGIPFANIIDPTVSLHSNIAMGTGNIIMAFSRVGPCAVLGDNNFLSAYVNIEHHNVLGDNCTFGPGVYLSGSIQIGDEVLFGTGIYIEPRRIIGSRSIIASGSIITQNIPPDSIVKTISNIKIGSKK